MDAAQRNEATTAIAKGIFKLEDRIADEITPHDKAIGKIEVMQGFMDNMLLEDADAAVQIMLQGLLNKSKVDEQRIHELEVKVEAMLQVKILVAK